ncbi:hypothetical protein PtB15_13B562 [Puccinia triticina]|nr:hypothetical protein PtB15_13B562 [Puccinia triticina]
MIDPLAWDLPCINQARITHAVNQARITHAAASHQAPQAYIASTNSTSVTTPVDAIQTDTNPTVSYTQVINDPPSATKKKSPIAKAPAAQKKRKVGSKSKGNADDPTTSNEIDSSNKILHVNCHTSFKLFALDQIKKGKSTWIPINSEESFDIVLIARPKDQATTYNDFNKLVAAQCEEVERNTAHIITDLVKLGKPVIKWSVSIPRVHGFQKGKPFRVVDKKAFNTWIETLAENKTKDAIRKDAKRTIEQAKEAKGAELIKSGKRKPDDGSGSDNNDEDGVSIESPPNDLRYETLLAKRAKVAAVNSTLTQQYTCHSGACHDLHQHLAQLPLSSDGPQLAPSAGIQDYVNFIGGLREADKVIDILIENNMTNYKSFRSPNLDCNYLIKELHLTVEVVTQLCDYVGKFEKHLAKQQASV